MAEEEIFVYTGGVPRDVRRVRIDKSIKIIPGWKFQYRSSLIYVEFHDGIDRIEKWAFHGCISLRSVKLLGVKVIKKGVFAGCSGLTDVEFGDKLETIEQQAFSNCTSLRIVTMPSVRTIGYRAFYCCIRLTDLALPEGLETVEQHAFGGCPSLNRITMPLKDGMIEDDVFYECPNLTTVTLVGGIHKTVASLHLESWKNEMRQEINRINRFIRFIRINRINRINRFNQFLSITPAREKTAAIQRWIESVVGRIEHYETEHKVLLKEATTLLELALWKANLDDDKGGILEKEGVGTTRVQRKRARKERCITSGASIVIKNVLPFLTLLE